jgi:hypothetical protein
MRRWSGRGAYGLGEKGLERRIHSEGLLPPDDRLIAVEVGDVLTWGSNGRRRSANRPNMAMGYGNRGLAIVGQEWVVGVDLLMVRQVEVLDEETSRPTLKIAFIEDRNGSMTESCGVRRGAGRRASSPTPSSGQRGGGSRPCRPTRRTPIRGRLRVGSR